MEWTVGEAGPSDASALALTGAATFLDTYAGLLDGDDIVRHCGRVHVAAEWASLLEGGCQAWLARAATGGAPVGFALSGPPSLPAPDAQASDVELRRLYVLSRFHGGGLGRSLLDRAVEAARAAERRRMLLGVHRENGRALAFYAKVGFRPVGRRLFRVGSAEHDDLVLALDLG